MTIVTLLTEDEQAIESHWLTKGDQGLLFLIIEGTSASDSGLPTTGTYRRIMLAVYRKYEDGYAYCGPMKIPLLGNSNVGTGLGTRWDLEPAREMWRTFLSNGWKYEEEWAKIPR
jgi:hypothetical protein